MSVFDTKTVEYAYPHYPWQSDEAGFYFSDDCIHPFVMSVKPFAKQTFEQQLQTELSIDEHIYGSQSLRLSWEQSCQLVISAFKDFSPSLGAKAEKAINSKYRWHLTETTPGNAVGVCLPANCEENTNPFAVIDYQYDGTINDPVYIAHELGHLIADDMITEAGLYYQDRKIHLAEVQAFFAQHILYDYLSTHQDERIHKTALSHFVYEIVDGVHSVPIGIGALDAEKVFQAGGNSDTITATYEQTMDDWLGSKWRYHKRAKNLSDKIQCPNARDDLGIVNLHYHAMASILAYGLFAHVRGLTDKERNKTIEMLYGAHGSETLNNIFEQHGIVSKNDLQILANKSISEISSSFEQWRTQSRIKPPVIINEYVI